MRKLFEWGNAHFGGPFGDLLYKIGNHPRRPETVTAARKFTQSTNTVHEKILMEIDARRARRPQFEWHDGTMRLSKAYDEFIATGQREKENETLHRLRPYSENGFISSHKALINKWIKIGW